MYLSDIYTIAVNLAGLPGMSVPCGFADGLPVGLQVVGARFADDQVLRVCRAYEKHFAATHPKTPMTEQD